MTTEAFSQRQHQQEGFTADNTNAEDAILQERHQMIRRYSRPPSVAEINNPFVGQAPAYSDSIDNATTGGPDLLFMQRDQARTDLQLLMSEYSMSNMIQWGHGGVHWQESRVMRVHLYTDVTRKSHL